MLRKRSKEVMFGVMVVSLMFGALPAVSQAPHRVVPSVADLSDSLESTARLVSPSVVEIFTTSYLAGDRAVSRTGDLVSTQRACGSGVILDPDGYIVTNAHVVRGAHRVRVALPSAAAGHSILSASSRSLSAEVVGIDLETDLAVIKVDGRDLPALAFGDSDELRTGQLVLAVGSPLGLRNSVSFGVVSAVARQLEPESPMIYVQTDASINPGSSGGALVDLHGRLVGINTLIMSQGGGNEGLGFAAPSNIVRTVYEQIRKYGMVRRGDIGIRTQTVTPVLAAGLNLARDYGAVVADVLPGSAAARVGLLPGDLVLTLDDKPIENGRQLQVNLYRHVAGDVVELRIVRDGEILNVPVPMNERPHRLAQLPAGDPRENLVPRLGILGVTLDPMIAEMLPAMRVGSGVVVVSTVAGAIDAQDGGLTAGDIIYSVNRTPVSCVSELRKVLDTMKDGDPVVLQLERQGELVYLAFTVEP